MDYADLRGHPEQLDACIHGHESIHLLENGRAVALITPLPAITPSRPVAWPDFAGRMQAVFGDVTLPAGSIQSLMDEERGAR